MKTLWVFAIIGFWPAIMWGQSDKKSDKSVIDMSPLLNEAKYLSLFQNFGDYLDELEKSGAINGSEKAQVEKTLLSHGIKRESVLPAVKISKKTVQSGSFKLSILGDGSLKTQSGRIIRFSEGMAFDRVFLDTYQKLVMTSLSSQIFEILEPQAKADWNYEVDSAELALMTAGGYIAHAAVNGIWTLGLGTVAAICTLPLNAVDWVKFQVRYLIYDSKVFCAVDGSYKILKYPTYAESIPARFELGKTLNEQGRGLMPTPNQEGLADAGCYGPLDDLIGGPLTESKNDRLLSPSLIEKALQKKDRCNPENAKLVQQFIQSEAKKIQPRYAGGKGKQPQSSGSAGGLE